MILIPVGHEQSALKRRPWVTFGLMGLCLILFLLSGGAG